MNYSFKVQGFNSSGRNAGRAHSLPIEPLNLELLNHPGLASLTTLFTHAVYHHSRECDTAHLVRDELTGDFDEAENFLTLYAVNGGAIAVHAQRLTKL